MRIKSLRDMSIVEAKELLKRTKDKNRIKRIQAKIIYWEREHRKAIEKYEKSPSLKLASKILHKAGKTKPIIRQGVIVGHEYDLCEAILVLHELIGLEEDFQDDNEESNFRRASSVRELVNG